MCSKIAIMFGFEKDDVEVYSPFYFPPFRWLTSASDRMSVCVCSQSRTNAPMIVRESNWSVIVVARLASGLVILIRYLL